MEQKKSSEKVNKLAALKAEQTKRLAAVAAAEAKAKAIAEKIEERKQHEKEVKELDTLCKKNKISYKQIISFCKCISEKGFTVDDIISLISDDNKPKEEKSE